MQHNKTWNNIKRSTGPDKFTNDDGNHLLVYTAVKWLALQTEEDLSNG